MPIFRFCDGCDWAALKAKDIAEAERKVRDEYRTLYDCPEGARVTVAIHGENGEEVNAIIDIQPNHQLLIELAVHEARLHISQYCGLDPRDHDWSSEGEGGCRENPGHWAVGGTGHVSVEHCTDCGLKRREFRTGSQYNPGDHDTVEYWVE